MGRISTEGLYVQSCRVRDPLATHLQRSPPLPVCPFPPPVRPPGLLAAKPQGPFPVVTSHFLLPRSLRPKHRAFSVRSTRIPSLNGANAGPHWRSLACLPPRGTRRKAPAVVFQRRLGQPSPPHVPRLLLLGSPMTSQPRVPTGPLPSLAASHQLLATRTRCL